MAIRNNDPYVDAGISTDDILIVHFKDRKDDISSNSSSLKIFSKRNQYQRIDFSEYF